MKGVKLADMLFSLLCVCLCVCVCPFVHEHLYIENGGAVDATYVFTAPNRKEPSPRVVIQKLPQSETVYDKESGVHIPPPPTPAASAPTPASFPYPAGRGLLRLMAPPKLANIPAPAKIPLGNRRSTSSGC